ncbi:hypothetical protein NQ314_010153 [Rhamnusium bicolor]|uniref:Uncharacterized protein n=1 Tax=Rhamnusium bicolor TaxID=1586634 RepID=A0AAV8XSM3_9CUCU|nr:hypothetical protein NQ314_010153 [Rhamnusium bicolor]
MVMTVNTFPPDLIIEVKSRIYKVVNDLELRSLTMKQQPQLPLTQQPQQYSRPSTSHSHV